MICPHCQKNIPSDSLVCGYCGHKIEEILQKEEIPTAEKAFSTQEEQNGLSGNEKNELSESVPLVPAEDSEASSGSSSDSFRDSDFNASEDIFSENATEESSESLQSQAHSESDKEDATASIGYETAVAENSAAEPADGESSLKKSEEDKTNMEEPDFGDTQETISVSDTVGTQNASSDDTVSVNGAAAAEAETHHNLEVKESHDGKKVSPEKKLEEAYIRRMAKRQRPLKTASFFWTEFLLLIPGINLVLLFVWAFRKKANANRKAFARSLLIWILLFILFLLIVLVVMIVLGVPVDKYIWLKSFQDWVAGLTV